MPDISGTGRGELRSSSDLLEATLQKPDLHRQWARAYRTPAAARFGDLLFGYIDRVAGVAEGATFLDAGCGVADCAVRLAKRGMRVVAVDFSESVLQMARETVERSGLQDRITLQRENILSLSFKDEAFDAILCWGVLMHIPEVERAISELARVLRCGGVAVIGEGNMFSIQSALVRVLRRLLGRHRSVVRRTPAGLEYWATTSAGTLVTRHADLRWLIGRFEAAQFTVIRHVAGQFTDLYASVSSGPMRGLMHGLNRAWFKYITLPQPAFGSLLILRKSYSGDRGSRGGDTLP